MTQNFTGNLTRARTSRLARFAISEPLLTFIMPHAKRKLAGWVGSWSSQRAFVHTAP